MFEEFYEMYEPEEQEVVALINRCIGGGYNWKGKFWEMTVVTLGMVFCDTWDKAMRELAAKNLTELANNWLSQDEENPRDPETDPITEGELARRISMTSLSVTSGGSFTAWFDCDEIFTDHAVTVYGSLKKGLKTANIEG